MLGLIILVIVWLPELLHNNIGPKIDKVVKLNWNYSDYQRVKAHVDLHLVNIITVCVKYSDIFELVLRRRRFKNLYFRDPVAVFFPQRYNLRNVHDSWKCDLQVLASISRLVQRAPRSWTVQVALGYAVLLLVLRTPLY